MTKNDVLKKEENGEVV